MTQEQKDLLLKDLCARLPYGVKAYVKHWSNLEWKYYENVYTVKSTFPSLNDVHVQSETGSVDVLLGHSDYVIKPYLFPLESMTDEQKKYVYETGDSSILNRFYFVGHVDSDDIPGEEIKMEMDEKGNFSVYPYELAHVRRYMLKFLKMEREHCGEIK